MQKFLSFFHYAHFIGAITLIALITITPGLNVWAVAICSGRLLIATIDWTDDLVKAVEKRWECYDTRPAVEKHLKTFQRKFFLPILIQVLGLPFASILTYTWTQSAVIDPRNVDPFLIMLLWFPMVCTFVVYAAILIIAWINLYKFTKEASKWPGANT